jgi:hypothetical protein
MADEIRITQHPVGTSCVICFVGHDPIPARPVVIVKCRDRRSKMRGPNAPQVRVIVTSGAIRGANNRLEIHVRLLRLDRGKNGYNPEGFPGF